jgi:HPr kinase/phosphorylase
VSQHLVHASCVCFGNRGVLIRGASGSGKSDLVLRLIDGEGFGLGPIARRAKLVADDQVLLNIKTGALFASPPQTLAGKLEIRGQGIIETDFIANIKIHLVVDLVSPAEIERMPEDFDLKTELHGIEVKRIKIFAEAASAPARIRAFLS